MAERRKPREVETSKLILLINLKEELLLQKRLVALDSMKRQVADSYTLGQCVLYNRFRTKLRRSELTHARLMERRDLVGQLKPNISFSFNTTVTDNSKVGVREILQSASSNGVRQNVRRQSAPTRSRPSQTVSQGGTRAGTAHFKRAEKGMEKRRESQFPAVTPVCTALSVSSEGLLTQRPYTVTGATLGAEHGPLQTPERRRTAGVKFVSFGEQSDTGGIGESPQPRGSSRPSSKRRDRGHRRESALSIFLNIGESQEMPSLLEIHARLIREAQLEDRVRRFINAAQSEQQCASTLGDYYSERLLAMLTARSTKPALDTDPSGWDFVGKETNYRSITFKKLDVDYFSKPCPAGDLVLEKLQ